MTDADEIHPMLNHMMTVSYEEAEKAGECCECNPGFWTKLLDSVVYSYYDVKD